jgi:hypothetical protein
MRGKIVAAEAALEVTGDANEFRHPLKSHLFCLCRTSAHPPTKKLFALAKRTRDTYDDPEVNSRSLDYYEMNYGLFILFFVFFTHIELKNLSAAGALD